MLCHNSTYYFKMYISEITLKKRKGVLKKNMIMQRLSEEQRKEMKKKEKEEKKAEKGKLEMGSLKKLGFFEKIKRAFHFH